MRDFGMTSGRLNADFAMYRTSFFSAFRCSRAVAGMLLCLTMWPGDGFAQNTSPEAQARREQYLKETLTILRPSRTPQTGLINRTDKTWEEWQKRTGELPPDFASMPSQPLLPDPLAGVPEAGIAPVTTPEEWEKKRTWIAEQAQQWQYGRIPPAPEAVHAEVLSSEMEGNVQVDRVMLSFGPGNKAKLLLEIATPPGDGPFPVFLTNHPRWRPWMATAVRRGYIGVFYSASDPNYSITDYSETYLDAYPDYDFSTIARWGWSASRAVDYLYTLPKVDKSKIGVTGHSRNGKQALMAAAFDKRIGAVILSSGNTGEGTPWRYTSDIYANETIEDITGSFPHWFHPRLRFFAGREDKLPIDQTSIMSMVAPRGLMIASAYSESQGAPMGMELGYESVRKVYRLLGAEDKVTLHLRAGEHATMAGDIENYVDFLDYTFGRSTGERPEAITFGNLYSRWAKKGKNAPETQAFAKRKPVRLAPERWQQQKAEVRESLLAMLGTEPAGLPFGLPADGTPSRYPSDGWLGMMYGRPLKRDTFTWQAVGFGDDIRGDLYRPAGASADAKLPVVIWLHQDAHPTGYSRYFRPVLEKLIESGFAVLSYDQIGFGSRIHDAAPFYRRYPGWSLMGKMVADARAAVDMAARVPGLDADRIFVAGWSIGAKVGLYATALEPRVRGLAMVAGFRPQRPEDATGAKELAATEGLAQYSTLQGYLPLVAEFVDRPQDLPVDEPEVLALVAPRPALVIAPSLDRYAAHSLVKNGVSKVQEVYRRAGAAGALELQEPLDFNRFEKPLHDAMAAWLKKVAAK
jgi:dienelactone hydrolase